MQPTKQMICTPANQSAHHLVHQLATQYSIWLPSNLAAQQVRPSPKKSVDQLAIQPTGQPADRKASHIKIHLASHLVKHPTS